MNNILKEIDFKARYVIIGNSAAGISCAESIRSEDKNSEIIILTNEKYDNYSKPLISYFLAGKVDLKNIYFRNADFYESNKLILLKDFDVKKIDFQNREILSRDNKKVVYEKLCIAAGGIPIVPDIELMEILKEESSETDYNKNNSSSDLYTGKVRNLTAEDLSNIEGIFTFTTLDDVLKIKNYTARNKIKESVILGGGLIGLKSAESLLDLNLKMNIIEMSDRLLPASFDKEASEIYEKAFEEVGSKVLTGETVKRIYTEANKIKRVETGSGKTISSEMLIIAAGVKPNINFIDKGSKEFSSLIRYKGIKTDKYMKTLIPDVFAAGDIAENENVLKKSIENIAIWPLAVRQGRIAGKNMTGLAKEYYGGFAMNSVEIFGIPSVAVGITNPYDFDEKHMEIIKDYKKDTNTYKKIIIFDNLIIGALLIGNIERAGIFSGLIANKVNVEKIKDLLLRDDFGVIQLPSEYKKHLVTGEAIAI